MDEFADRGNEPIPAALVVEMTAKGRSPSDPVPVRILKEESELEVWKRDRTGKLGPKTAEGDRQAPEGFYHVTAGMLNPQSQYYLSFNLGYPNRLERSLGYTGDSLMVHGFAMTDDGVAEICAVVRDALRAGQESVQAQSYPFRMTVRNMARHRTSPPMAFRRNLKEGYDLFEAKRLPPRGSSCGGRYAFNMDFPACQTALNRDP